MINIPSHRWVDYWKKLEDSCVQPVVNKVEKIMEKQKSIDLSRPVQTRDGRKVRILCTDAKGDMPVHGLIDNGHYEIPWAWYRSGETKRNLEISADLINIPTKRTGWINVYPTSHPAAHSFEASSVFLSRAVAKSNCRNTGQTICIEWDE